jgi:oligoendopeptidase F
MIAVVLMVGVLLGLQAAAGATPKTKIRAEIPEKYKWNFNDMYPSWQAWELDKAKLEAKMNEFAALKGTLSKTPEGLLKAYLLSDEVGVLGTRVYRYPDLMRAVDSRDNEVSAKLQEVELLYAKFGTATAWFNPELLAIPWATMEKWLKETPALTPYRFGIADLYRKQKHVLDEQGERLLSYFGPFTQTPSSIYGELAISDIKFKAVKLSDGKDVTLTEGEYFYILGTNRNQSDRKLAFENHYATYNENINTYAAIYNGILQRDWASAQARSYQSTLEASLDDYNVPTAVVENLISVVRAGCEPMQRYLKLRKKALKLETYHLYDGSIPVVDFQRDYDYDSVRPWMVEAVAPLGKAYQAKMKTATASGWIDVFENEGKTSGAFSAGVYGVHPYLLLNYTGTTEDVFTLIHELGHCLHSQLSNETQPYATSQYTLFVAEVASTLDERLLLDYMLKRSTNPKERIKLLQQAIDNLMGTFYGQVMFADFELQAHRLVEQGQPITADVLKEVNRKIDDEYYGDAVARDELYSILWARISHFYDTPYYVYQYATCYASSAKIYEDITSKNTKVRKAAIDNYLTLLKSGGNDFPMEQLKRAGVDLSRPETVKAVVKQLDVLVTQLEEELGRIAE